MSENNSPMPALQRLLSGGALAENGWAGLSETDADSTQKRQEAELARYEAAAEIAGPFMTPGGRTSLRKLRELTIERPTWPAEGQGGFYDAAAYGFAREGQNSIIRHIEACIALVEKGPPVLAAPATTKTKGKKSNIQTNN